MKSQLLISEGMLDNKAAFVDPFFSRFTLRKADKPLDLDGTISKDYLFPTLYSDVTCAIGIFMCSYAKANRLVAEELGSDVKPVRMTRGRSIVAFSCYEYRNVLGIAPYNEIAMTIPVLVPPALDLPVVPLVASKYPNSGYYVFSMPVTSKENQIRGNKIWGLPKITRDIAMAEEDGLYAVRAFEETGEPYFELRIPTEGNPTRFDVSSVLYSRLGNELLGSKTCFKGTFSVTKNMGLLFKQPRKPENKVLSLGWSSSAEKLRYLEIEEAPFQTRFARGMNSCFDLPSIKISGGKL